MAIVSKVLSLASAEKGYVEKNSNSNLDVKLANEGTANFTKYARDLDAIGFFNGRKQGYAWCSVYVHWLFYKAFGKDKTLSMLYEPSSGNLGAGVDYLWKYFNGHTYSEPQVGDLIIFSNSKYTYAHVGLVINTDSTYIYTSEGNTNNSSAVVSNGGAVCEKKYLKTNKNIVGYCRPNWSIVGGYDYGKKVTQQKFSISVPELSNGCNGEQVRALQVMLVSSGYGVGLSGCDGDFGTNTETAVKEFQKRNGLTSDGIAGKKTYMKLWGIQ